MAGFVLSGVFVIIALIACAVLSIVGLFVGNIILFDSIGLGVLAGAMANQYLPIHPAFCLLIGIAAFGLLFKLQNNRFGFWLIGGAMSLFWSLIIAAIAYGSNGHDWIWTYVIMGIAFVVCMGLHITAKAKMQG